MDSSINGRWIILFKKANVHGVAMFTDFLVLPLFAIVLLDSVHL